MIALPKIFLPIWRRHLLVGVPIAAFLHSCLQFAFDSPVSSREVWLFPLHFTLGVIVGSVVLVPAFSFQAAIFYFLRSKDCRSGVVIMICGACQASLVGLWAIFVGIQPSLAGRFHLTVPMIVAGFVAGVLASISATSLVQKISVRVPKEEKDESFSRGHDT